MGPISVKCISLRNDFFPICSSCLVAQSCPTLCDPLDYSPPGSSVHRILPARILEWIAFPFSRRSSWPTDWTLVCSYLYRILQGSLMIFKLYSIPIVIFLLFSCYFLIIPYFVSPFACDKLNDLSMLLIFLTKPKCRFINYIYCFSICYWFVLHVYYFISSIYFYLFVLVFELRI